MRSSVFILVGLLAAGTFDSAAAQQKSMKSVPGLAGTWQLAKGKVQADGPKTVVIRPDSSATWGKETVRWRLKGDQIMIALGGEWEIYKIKVAKDKMTLSGGDLTEAITLKKVGPPTARPDSIPIPPDPDTGR